MKAIYKSIALLFGAMSMFSSCEDFLTRDPQDSFLLKDYLADDAALADYTSQIYGPLTWNGFDDKFSWCVGELYSGNVYHNFSDEGQFHFMTFTNTNSHIQNGYTSLYGVIAKCNHIINDVPAIAQENGLSPEVLNTVLGEAHMFRGMAYFYLAEYWGASPIILKNSQTIASDAASQVTRADRKSLYALIEKDWQEAYNLLPAEAQARNHVWKASAAGMLAKLYVTMASCQTVLEEPGSYYCENPVGYYEQAVTWANACLGMTGTTLSSDYDRIFWPMSDDPEILFALCFEQGVYAQGCSRQIQFARSMHLAGGGDAYGGEKGLTTMLFNSYEKGDIRLKGTSYYNGKDEVWGATSSNDAATLTDMKNGTGHYYDLYDGSKYYYFLNPNKSIAEEDRIYGNEPNSAIFNHCRKFIYSIKPEVSPFSINLTIPILRVADVLLLRAEALMGMESRDITNPSTAGLADINIVRARAGLAPVTKCAFCVEDSVKRGGNEVKATVQNAAGQDVEITANCDIYYPTYDLMMERRHELALENQSWLDIKRLYYRNPAAARYYIESQDRSYTFVEKYNSDIAIAQKRADFQRADLVYKLSVKAHEVNPTYAIQASEGVIELDKLQYFLPVPANVPQTGSFATIADYSEQIKNGSYPY